jgi:hypothetical protein
MYMVFPCGIVPEVEPSDIEYEKVVNVTVDELLLMPLHVAITDPVPDWEEVSLMTGVVPPLLVVAVVEDREPIVVLNVTV